MVAASVVGRGAPAEADNVPRRLLIVGDSVGFSLFPGFEQAGSPRGVEVESAALFGCPVVEGDPVSDDGTPFPNAPTCKVDRASHYRSVVTRFRPDVVVWIGSWETSARIVDGQLFRFGTIAGNRELTQKIDEAVHWFTDSGARVVFVPLAPSAQPSDHGVPSSTNDARITQLTNVLRIYAEHHADAVSFVDLPAMICAHGPPCPAVVDGVVLRPADGIHFEGAGPAWVADHVLPLALQRPPPPTPPANGANAALTGRPRG
jgi:hypothetical protein